MPHVDLSSLPGIGDIPDALRVLMALGLSAFLVMLRFDAERFNAAEYDDVDRWGNKPSIVRRLAWYTLGIGGILAVLWIHPAPAQDLFLGLGDRLSAVMLGLAYGAIGTAIALGIALYRYHTVRLPPVASLPGRDPQRDRDGVLRRGGLPRAAVRVPDLDRPRAEPRQPHPGAASTRSRRGSGRRAGRGTC